MIDRNTALSIVKRRLELAGERGLALTVDEAKTVQFEGGWIFFYNSARFLETGDPGAAVPGNVPYIVGRDDGILRLAFPPFGTAEQLIASHQGLRAHPKPDPLERAIWHSLWSSQFHLAEVNGPARRYRPSVAPFASVDANTTEAMSALAELMDAGEVVYVSGDEPAASPRLRYDGVVPCLQMLLPADAEIAEVGEGVAIEELNCTRSGEMMELIAIAFPGYFREETCLMGRYFGVRDAGRLIAMGGERMVFEADGVMWREVSALCTHPAYTGRGLGKALLQHVVRAQRALGAMSFLHVIESNANAIRLYEQCGFERLRVVNLHRLVRKV